MLTHRYRLPPTASFATDFSVTVRFLVRPQLLKRM
jgi:hypothetical protein